MEGAFSLRWVEHGIVENGPAVSRAFIGFALKFASPRGESLLKLLDGGCVHALVVGRVAKVEPRFDPWEHQVRTGGIVCFIETAAMKGSDCGDGLWPHRRGAKRERAAEAIADHSGRAAAHGRLRYKKIDVSGGVLFLLVGR